MRRRGGPAPAPLAVGAAGPGVGDLAGFLDLLQAACVDVYCWLLDRGWVGE